MRKELLVAALATVAIIAIYQGTQAEKGDAFGEWKGQFGANWAPEEEAYRRLIFERNVLKIEKHNSDNTQTYKMGINQFTIYSDEEFAKLFLTPMPASEALQGEEVEVAAVNGDIDWTTKGMVSPVKNQGQCGSCWAFSATGAMESWAKQKGQTVNLSEQQLVDCSRAQGNQGCNGGWPYNAIKYVQANGIASTSEYPYVAKDQSCKKNGGSFKVSGYNSYSGCTGIMNQISNSPVSVTVDATNWSAYRSGAFSNCRTSINHAVLLVGVVGGNWKIKNSWGTSWGESGYIRLASSGSSTCGVCSYAGVVPK
jgi:C1A family cysteine protease